jgi:hypothetical protein
MIKLIYKLILLQTQLPISLPDDTLNLFKKNIFNSLIELSIGESAKQRKS